MSRLKWVIAQVVECSSSVEQVNVYAFQGSSGPWAENAGRCSCYCGLDAMVAEFRIGHDDFQSWGL